MKFFVPLTLAMAAICSVFAAEGGFGAGGDQEHHFTTQTSEAVSKG